MRIFDKLEVFCTKVYLINLYCNHTYRYAVHTMQKICYTYVKPRMYNKVILVVYIPYVILMFTCGV